MGFVYLITCIKSHKQYVGQTTLPRAEMREKQHYQKAIDGTSGCRALSDAIREHGIENFKFEVLLECNNDKETLNMFEIKMITLYNTLEPHGYNSTRGGSGGLKSDAAKKATSDGLLKRNETYVYKRSNPSSILVAKKYITAYTGTDESRGFRYRPFNGDDKIITSKTRPIEDIAQEMLEYVEKYEKTGQAEKNCHEEGNEPGVQKIKINNEDKGYRFVWMENGKEKATTNQKITMTMDQKRIWANEKSIQYYKKECSSTTKW